MIKKKNERKKEMTWPETLRIHLLLLCVALHCLGLLVVTAISFDYSIQFTSSDGLLHQTSLICIVPAAYLHSRTFLKRPPDWPQNMLSQYRWSFMIWSTAYSPTLKCRVCCQEYVSLQDRWFLSDFSRQVLLYISEMPPWHSYSV